jgi:hypothetical protein
MPLCQYYPQRHYSPAKAVSRRRAVNDDITAFIMSTIYKLEQLPGGNFKIVPKRKQAATWFTYSSGDGVPLWSPVRLIREDALDACLVKLRSDPNIRTCILYKSLHGNYQLKIQYHKKVWTGRSHFKFGFPLMSQQMFRGEEWIISFIYENGKIIYLNKE